MNIEGIYTCSWEVENPKANIILVHGLGEHIDRYRLIAQYFNSLGWNVFGFDHIGHGKSKGKRGHISSYEKTYRIIEELSSNLPKQVPIFLYGHSFGGNTVLSYMVERQPTVQGVISTGAFIEFGKNTPKILIFIGKIMSFLYPSLTMDNGLDLNGLSTDQQVITDYVNDPLVHNKVSARLANLMIKAANRLKIFKGNLSAPLLIMHGEKDIITGPSGSNTFASNVKSEVTLNMWKGGYHEIHNDLDKQKVWEFISEWIQSHIK